jgi:hypothetical protein
MHEPLLRHQKALADDDLRRYATDLGLDVARFSRDRGRERGRERGAWMCPPGRGKRNGVG